MKLWNSQQQWGLIAKFLHWSIAALIFTAMATAILNNQLQAEGWQRELATELMNIHRSCGVTAFVLGLLRALLAVLQPRPALPSALNSVDRRAARFSHRAIYALALCVPLTGWLTTSAFGSRTLWFWSLPIPLLIEPNREIVAYFYHSHWVLYHVLAILVVLHVGAACWHHFSQRDDTLRRMLP